jgi:hypothetical protein
MDAPSFHTLQYGRDGFSHRRTAQSVYADHDAGQTIWAADGLRLPERHTANLTLHPGELLDGVIRSSSRFSFAGYGKSSSFIFRIPRHFRLNQSEIKPH